MLEVIEILVAKVSCGSYYDCTKEKSVVTFFPVKQYAALIWIHKSKASNIYLIIVRLTYDWWTSIIKQM